MLDFFDGRIEIDVERAIIIKVLTITRMHIFNVRCRMINPEFFIQQPSTPTTVSTPKPAGKWNENKLYLIELIYLIKRFVDGATLIAIQQCFEYSFEVELGDISNRKGEICEKKTGKKGFIETLFDDLKEMREDLNK